MKTWLSILFLFVHLVTQAQTMANWHTIKTARFDLHTTAADSVLTPSLISMLEQGVAQIEGFFNQPFPKHFDVWVFPDRGALDRQWQHDWNDSTFQSQCWMVASGVSHRLDLLSPQAWEKQACEHKASDSLAMHQLLTHELVHVYHGQHCPIPDFTGMEAVAWWPEGLATYVSGQLGEPRLTRVRALVQAGKTPAHLEEFWSGANRYGLSGSVVASIDKRYGRGMLRQLMAQTTVDALFKEMNTDETALLKGWNEWLSGG